MNKTISTYLAFCLVLGGLFRQFYNQNYRHSTLCKVESVVIQTVRTSAFEKPALTAHVEERIIWNSYTCTVLRVNALNKVQFAPVQKQLWFPE